MHHAYAGRNSRLTHVSRAGALNFLTGEKNQPIKKVVLQNAQVFGVCYNGSPKPSWEGIMVKSIAAVLVGATVLFGPLPAEATIVYVMNETGFQSQLCYPNCAATSSLTGTITTDGTIGVGLSPSIITSWNLSMDVGSQHTILTNANSSLAYNDSALLTATATSIDFDFSAKNLTVDGTSEQYYFEFNSSSLGTVAFYTAVYAGSSFGPQFTPGRMNISPFVPQYSSNVKNYPAGTQLIEIGKAAPIAPVPLHASIISQVSALALLAVLIWRRRRTPAQAPGIGSPSRTQIISG